MYEVNTTETSKGLFSKEDYQCFNSTQDKFETLEEVKEFLKDKYGNCKKEKMYIDDKDGNAKHIGWIYSFRNRDISHMSEWWIQRDWVDISEVNCKRVVL